MVRGGPTPPVQFASTNHELRSSCQRIYTSDLIRCAAAGRLALEQKFFPGSGGAGDGGLRFGVPGVDHRRLRTTPMHASPAPRTARGTGLIRGLVTGAMTTVGGVFHALPFLIHDRNTAIAVALVVVLAELIAISVIGKRFLRMSPRNFFIPVTLGGILILAVGLLLGSARSSPTVAVGRCHPGDQSTGTGHRRPGGNVGAVADPDRRVRPVDRLPVWSSNKARHRLVAPATGNPTPHSTGSR